LIACVEQIINKAVTAKRAADTRALREIDGGIPQPLSRAS
jgi:hypothetical protein